MSCSPLSRAGASEATVCVNDFSRWKAWSMPRFTASSARVACSYRNSRARPICTARRSVGVGPRAGEDDDGSGCVSAEGDSGDDARGMVSEKGEGVGPAALGMETSKSS